MLDYPKSDLLPHLHPQWSKLDFFTLFKQPFVYLAIGYSNSILAEFGAQAGERLWERARTPGGALDATKAVVSAVRAARRPVVWTRYEIFRDRQPQTEIDRAQYTYWVRDKQGWGDAEIERDWQLVVEIKALMRAEDLVIHYSSHGNVFLGTMLPSFLNAWGVRTVLVSGFHLDWCIEQAVRTCRDLGYNPIVVGDACGCGQQGDDIQTLRRINTFFAPVISSARLVSLLASLDETASA
jgi:nicotinamidase-related amidase